MKKTKTTEQTKTNFTLRLDEAKTAIDNAIQRPLTPSQARDLLKELIDYIEITDDALKDDVLREEGGES